MMALFRIAGTALAVFVISCVLFVICALKCKARHEDPEKNLACVLLAALIICSPVLMLITASTGFLMAIW